jgi:hypothetical protein
MRRLMQTLGAVIVVLALAPSARAWDETPPPETGWELWSLRAGTGFVFGAWPALRGDEPVWVPYQETNLFFEAEVEAYDLGGPGHVSLLGGMFGMRGWMRIGGVVDRPIERPAGIAVNVPELQWWFDMGFGGGPILRIFRDTGFILAVHVSVDAHVLRPAVLSMGAFIAYGGVRMVWQPGDVRIQLGYDFAPFWVGESRLEHRASGAVGFKLPGTSVGLGVRATFVAGQSRTPDGGLDDFGLRLAAEVLL